MMADTILVIEDDADLQQLLKEYLAGFGYTVHTEGVPEVGLEAFKSLTPDLVILDVMLPGMNGFEVCRRIRQDSQIPIIMLTARGDVMDRVAGLEIGADDYLPKPFEPRELVARIQSILRRSRQGTTSGRGEFGSLRIDFDGRAALLNGEDIGLTTNEFNALAVLVRTPGKTFSRDDLMQELRGLDSESFNRSIDITMSRIRQKLGDDPKHPQYIKTVWGTGYVFIGQGNEDG
ncbi:response regulator transcription factor [Pseudodesulfovibrio thermohalotolerans]|uniref:response regulator transcription factor n=1 Tax=Pseudodesulfovibrio thermohalotolerans TaxID=2880651 RepID=UPI002442691F|nr:response regulator transcription factor [Pseudodesulfovibrio thermohalotolerans]WFS63837.1 response regulator transcription factor [Pseudodesulfovibrio thermohalotolerans]